MTFRNRTMKQVNPIVPRLATTPLRFLFIVGLVVCTVRAQSVPNFSGTWKIDPTRASAVGGGTGQGTGGNGGNGMGGGLGLGPPADTIVIVQTAASLTIDEHRGAGIAHLVYALDGKASRNAMPAGQSAGREAEYASVWNADRLMTTVSVLPTADRTNSTQYLETRYIEKDGSMVLEIRAVGQSNMRHVVYVKADGR